MTCASTAETNGSMLRLRCANCDWQGWWRYAPEHNEFAEAEWEDRECMEAKR